MLYVKAVNYAYNKICKMSQIKYPIPTKAVDYFVVWTGGYGLKWKGSEKS